MIKNILKHIQETGNINYPISNVDSKDISVSTKKALERNNITTLYDLSEVQIKDLADIVNLDEILSLFDKISNCCYYSNGTYLLNNRGKEYLAKVS